MKFRGFMSDFNAMREFMNLLQSFSKLSKECIIRILPDKLYFIIPDDETGPKRPYVFCQLQIDYYFKEYSMAGVSDEYNEIYLSFSSALFAKSLTPVRQGAKSLKMKLTNKDTACITLEFEVAFGDTIQTRTCVHDIPVEIVTRKHWNDYAVPEFNDFHITIQMPSIKSIRNIIERMKTMSQYLIVSANKTGRITLKIVATLITLSAHFPNLNVQSFSDSLVNNNDEDGEETNLSGVERTGVDVVSASVDIRKVVNFFAAMQFGSNKIVCNITHGKMVKFLVENPGAMSVQCFLTEYMP